MRLTTPSSLTSTMKTSREDFRRSPLPHFLFAILLLSVINSSHAIHWQTSSDAYWALNCDFVKNDIGSAVVPGHLCSSACAKVRGCTHFAWTLYNGGTCWYKSSSSVTKSQAIVNSQPSAACGILRSSSTVPQPPRPQPPRPVPAHETKTLRHRYLPIFLYDGSAGSYCFPDDKRRFAQRNGRCNGFNRRAPVFVTSKACGAYDVYQYNLWYGWQKACLLGFGKHDDDNEYVQVWVRRSTGSVQKVRYNQHNGYYFRNVGDGAEMRGNRAVVYIGKVAHGAYHRGCTGNPFRGGTRKCLGGCGYWEDFRNPKGRYDLDQGTVTNDPSPRAIECNPGVCKPGHNSWRSVKSSACYGVRN